MTEDDTFLKLKRVPFEEVMTLYCDHSARSLLSWLNTGSDIPDFIYEDYGWTGVEFIDEKLRRALINISSDDEN